MKNEELIKIIGGDTISATLINALVKAVNTALELGRTLGGIIRRTTDEEYTC